VYCTPKPRFKRGFSWDIIAFERIEVAFDEMRAVIEDEWPEPVHKLPPANPR
jgi:hypothetical protein